jgi:hypothetical protein
LEPAVQKSKNDQLAQDMDALTQEQLNVHPNLSNPIAERQQYLREQILPPSWHVDMIVESPPSPLGGLAEMTPAAISSVLNTLGSSASVGVGLSAVPLRPQGGHHDWLIFRNTHAGHLLEHGQGNRTSERRVFEARDLNFRRSPETPIRLSELVQEFAGVPIVLSVDLSQGTYNEELHARKSVAKAVRHGIGAEEEARAMRKDVITACFEERFHHLCHLLNRNAEIGSNVHTCVLFGNLGDLQFAKQHEEFHAISALSLKGHKDVQALLRRIDTEASYQFQPPCSNGSGNRNTWIAQPEPLYLPEIVTLNIKLIREMLGEQTGEDRPAYKRLPDLNLFAHSVESAIFAWGVTSLEEVALCRQLGITPVAKDQNLFIQS